VPDWNLTIVDEWLEEDDAIMFFMSRKEINPVFKPVWQTRKPYIILKGGRNSFKSSVIALKLVADAN